jgi:hypothetical protein
VKQSALLLCALLAACGPDTTPESASDVEAADSAALDAVTDPAPEPPVSREKGVVSGVNDRLEQAQKAEAARAEEAGRQVREAEGGAPPP